jgi:4-diphosphocytidyl-2C-methyl-D-erythritol kinase
LVETGIHCATGAVYGSLDLSLTPDPGGLKIVRDSLRDGRWRDLRGAVFNRLAESAFRLHPELGVLRAEIETAADAPVFLTGSGSALFLVTESIEEARRIRAELDRVPRVGKVHALAAVPNEGLGAEGAGSNATQGGGARGGDHRSQGQADR